MISLFLRIYITLLDSGQELSEDEGRGACAVDRAHVLDLAELRAHQHDVQIRHALFFSNAARFKTMQGILPTVKGWQRCFAQES